MVAAAAAPMVLVVSVEAEAAPTASFVELAKAVRVVKSLQEE